MAHRSSLPLLPRILLLIMLVMPSLAVSSARAQEAPTNWQPLSGPGGRLTHLAPAPGGQILYAVSVASVRRQADQTQWRDAGEVMRSDAIYRSSDAGLSWEPSTNDLPPGEITSLFVDTGGRVWAGIHGRGSAAGAGGGLWHSDDEGATWRRAPLDRADLVIRTITEDAKGSILLGAVDTGGFEQGLIYRLAQDAAGWTVQRLAVPALGAGARLARLLPHPDDAAVLFVLTTNGDLLRSTDGGASWQLPAGPARDEPGSAQLAFLPDQPDTALLVQTQAATSVKRTTDAGATWSEVRSTGLPDGPLAIRSMLAPSRSVLLLNTDAGTYRSADGGRRWQPLEGALSSGYVRAFAALGSDGRDVLAATDSGLFGSSDGGAIWQRHGVGQPVNSGVTALLTHEGRPAMIAAIPATQADADPPEMLMSRDAGRSWLPADGGGAWSEATAWAVDPNGPDIFYVAGQDYVAASTDGGFSWLVYPAEASSRTAIAVAPSDSSRIYVDGAPGLRSDDGGKTWTKLPVDGGPGSKTGLAVDPANALHVWAGAADGVYESRDAGTSWQRAGLDSQAVRWLATAGGTGEEGVTVYAGLEEGGIMRRAPGAAGWEPADSGLPVNSKITAFAADPRSPGLLWAARDGGGVYRSTDGGDQWFNMGVGLGENLGLSLAINYQAPGSVLLGTAIAGVWSLGTNRRDPAATETPAGSATSTPGEQGGRAGIDARVEVVWPHDFAPIDRANFANVGIRLFAPRSLEPPACGWQPEVQLWQAVDNEPAELVETADQRSVDGQPFPYWEANDLDVSAARDGSHKLYLLVAVAGVDTATSVWAHAADARTYFPEQQVPSGIATAAVDAVDARIQIVWPHDTAGNEKGVEQADLANVAVTLFKHGTRLSVSPDWSGSVTLYGAWNSEVARPLATEATLSLRQAGVITYPVWEFNDIPVDRARDKSNKLYLWAVAPGVTSYPTIWAHGADARTFFPEKDEPVQGCFP